MAAPSSAMRSARSVAALCLLALAGGHANAIVAPAPQASSGSLRLSAPAFSIGDFRYSGGEIDALPGREQVLVLNTRSLRLHTLPRAMGESDIPLARVTASGDSILSIERMTPAAPLTRIPRALEKLSRGQPLRIVCLGTSLVENGRGPSGWQRLLFPATFAAAQPATVRPADEQLAHVLEVPGRITAASHAVGGTNARYTAALLGEGRLEDRSLPTSVFDHDLAIVALLPNGGADRLAVFEFVVRRLRERGLEVLLLTDNAFATKAPDRLWTEGEFVRRLAERYDCGLADTAAYMAEGELRGEKVYQDNIHQSPAGHIRWAEAIAAVLAPGLEPTAATPAPRDSASQEPTGKIPDDVLLDFSPPSEGAKLSEQAADNRLAKVFGLPSSRCLDYPAGASLVVGAPGMIAADLVAPVSGDFRAELRTADGRFVRNIIQKRPAGDPQPWMRRPSTVNLLLPGDFQGTDSPSSFRLTVIEGTLSLHALSVQLRTR